MSLRRSLLFVPANRPELFDKALSGPADMICIELEDGVGPDQKDVARENMQALLTTLLNKGIKSVGAQAEILVRVNHPETAAGQDDLSTLLSLQTRSVGLMLPKISTAQELRSVEHHLLASAIYPEPLSVRRHKGSGIRIHDRGTTGPLQ